MRNVLHAGMQYNTRILYQSHSQTSICQRSNARQFVVVVFVSSLHDHILAFI